METDPTTGLPKLPEGYFWRVEPFLGNRTRWVLWIMRTRHGWFGKPYSEYWVRSEPSQPISHLNETTLEITARVMAETYFGGRRDLLGDYPPKVLA